MTLPIFRRLATIASFIVPFYATAVWAQDNRPEFAPDELLVKFREGATEQEVTAALSTVQGATLKRYRLNPIYHVGVPQGTHTQAAKALSARRQIEYVEPNYYRYFDGAPTDTDFGNMWGLNNTGQTGGMEDADIDAPEAWDITAGNPDLVIAIIDSGLDMDHEDIAANLWTNPGDIPGNGIDDDGNGYVDDVYGWDFTDNDNDPSDNIPACVGHGTHTAGTVGAVGNNGTGVTGVNWNVKLMPLKAAKGLLGIFCTLPDSATMEAIEYAAANGALISNNSYGGGARSQAQEDTIRASRRLFVAAAGNNGTDNDLTPQYPSNYPLDNIVSVAATNHTDDRASFSNYGVTTVDLGAPGDSILSTLPDDRYGSLSGTSMASPHVVGAAGLLLAADPSLTPNELKWRLLNSIDPIGIPVLTGGRLNAYQALMLPSPSASIYITPLSPTIISPRDTIQYWAEVANDTAMPQTVTASVVAVPPNGIERVLQRQVLNIGPGTTVGANFSTRAPSGVGRGEYYLIGRAQIGTSSFDEHLVTYTVEP